MATWKPIKYKIVQGRKFASKIEADMYCRSEKRAEWAKIGHAFQLKNIFSSESRLRALMGYNEHKNSRGAK